VIFADDFESYIQAHGPAQEVDNFLQQSGHGFFDGAVTLSSHASNRSVHVRSKMPSSATPSTS